MKRRLTPSCCLFAIFAMFLFAPDMGQALAAAPAVPMKVQRVSLADDEAQANERSATPVVSADGRYVAFLSWATNLVPEDANPPYPDVFVRDLQIGATQIASLDNLGNQWLTSPMEIAISGSGRFVAFVASVGYGIPGDTNGVNDVYVRDLVSGVTVRASARDGTSAYAGNGESRHPSLSADGRYVAFNSMATDLILDTNGFQDVFVRDLMTNATELISVSSDENQSNDVSWEPHISGDGRYVVFTSSAGNLVPGDTNQVCDTFVRDRVLGVTERISVSSAGVQANQMSLASGISADGRYVVFYSYADNLDPADTDRYYDLFLRDRQNGVTRHIASVGDASYLDDISGPQVSTDGRYVLFSTKLNLLAPGDTDDKLDVYLADMWLSSIVCLSCDYGATPQGAASWEPSLSADGRTVVFTSSAADWVPNDTNGFDDIFAITLGYRTFLPFAVSGSN